MEKQEAAETQENANHMSKGAKILLGCVIGIIVTVALVFGGFLAYIRITYADFYSQAKAEFETPGLSTGFVPQDIAYAPQNDAWFFSGYDDNNNPSSIWRLNSDGSISRITITEPNGMVYHGHGGGFTMSDEFSYLTCDNGFFVLRTDELLAPGDELVVNSVDMVEVGFDPAFINMQNGTLYTGVFYYEGPYSTPEKMHLMAPDGTQNYAVMYAYKANESARYGVDEQPFAVYSIPDKVQGVALTSSNEFVFSTSWGISDSTIPVYSSEGLTAAGSYEVNGTDVDLFFMDGQNLVRTIKAPPMMEGIIFHDGSIWFSNESASNKYFFGKLFGGGTVYSLPIE